MKIAVFSDIHSNYIALERCFHYAKEKGVDCFLFLGDYVSGCAYPQKMMQLIYHIKEKYKSYFIYGNGEEYMLRHKENSNDGWKASSATGGFLYTYQNLTERDLAFFQELKNKEKFAETGYQEFWYCHGSLDRSNECLFIESEAAKRALEKLDTDLLICGHTHIQGSFCYKGKKLINPGSIGQPFYYGGKAQFAILHSRSLKDKSIWEEEYIQLDYDRERVIQEFEESGLNQYAKVFARLEKDLILTGESKIKLCMNMVCQLAKEKGEEADWNNIEEKYWEEAAEKLNLL